MENFAGSIFSWDNFPEGDYSEVIVQGTKVQRAIVLGEFHEWRLPGGGAVIQEELFRSNCLMVIVLGDFISNIFSGCIVQGNHSGVIVRGVTVLGGVHWRQFSEGNCRWENLRIARVSYHDNSCIKVELYYSRFLVSYGD